MPQLLPLSRECVYAFKALTRLAVTDDVVPLRTIAAERELPEGYLYKVFGDLRKAGLVQSQRGRVRGFRLARPAETISVLDVVTACDGPFDTSVCVLDGERPCEAKSGCPLHCGWAELARQVEEIMAGMSLADLAQVY